MVGKCCSQPQFATVACTIPVASTATLPHPYTWDSTPPMHIRHECWQISSRVPGRGLPQCLEPGPQSKARPEQLRAEEDAAALSTDPGDTVAWMARRRCNSLHWVHG